MRVWTAILTLAVAIGLLSDVPPPRRAFAASGVIIVNPSCAASPTPAPSTGQSVTYVDSNGAACTNGQGGGSSGPLAAATTDASSTITTGGTFQQIAAASTSRKSLEFSNVCSVATECTTTANYCYIFFGASGANKGNSIPIPAGGSYLRSSGVIPSDAIQATCDGNSDHYRLALQ